MKKNIVKPFAAILAACLASLLLAAPAMSQERPMPPRMRLQRNLSALRLVRLTQALDLSEGQTAKIFPVLNRIDKSRQAIQKELSEDILGLRRMCLQPEARDSDLEAALTRIRRARMQLKDLDAEEDAALEEVLTVRQKARYEIFQIDFLRGLGETLNTARTRMGRGQGFAPDKKNN